ncbi:RNA-directed DNA polymerase from mobile element jockey [Eumeta japonica]|uniref:RNA-directed DNA polymerase from mobile element jockey n=1 Tax=Eumeta variegata TaxID=151549 RepID=A0A4C1XPB8_EUMVA|nr:RNA-directed DNA polymerase from mobile element jockey [Eumeta japonica]
MLLNWTRAHLSDVIPQHQFGFREKHGTIEQIHRITDIISRTLEFKQFCSAVFLDISQAFDRMWHQGLFYKIKKLLPHSFFPILKSYLEGRCFEVKYNNESSPLQKINSGVPQGSILGPVLYLIFTADIPTYEDTITATYADDTALLSVDKDSCTASAKLQAHVFKVENWLDKWRIRVNQGKSVHVTFTLRRETCPSIKLHNEEIPQAEDAKYLGMHLDRKLTWRKHI